MGDLSVRIEAKATDEIGTLVESFNRMTADLQGSKKQGRGGERLAAPVQPRTGPTARVYRNGGRYDCRGVLSIDRQGLITTFNPSAERMLGLWADRFRGRSANEVFKSTSSIYFSLSMIAC